MKFPLVERLNPQRTYIKMWIHFYSSIKEKYLYIKNTMIRYDVIMSDQYKNINYLRSPKPVIQNKMEE